MKLSLRRKRRGEPFGDSSRIPGETVSGDAVSGDAAISEDTIRKDAIHDRIPRDVILEDVVPGVDVPVDADGADPTDESLLAAYRDQRDALAFSMLVERYESELFHYLRNYLGDAVLAEDVFQATFLAIHMRCETFEDGRRFRPWLYAVATHQAIDAQRRLRRHRSTSLDSAVGDSADGSGRCRSGDAEERGSLYSLLSDESPDPAVVFGMREDAASVQVAVGALPELLRQAVLLVYFQGLKYREAAEVLGVPTGTVKSRLHAAIERLTREFVATDMET